MDALVSKYCSILIFYREKHRLFEVENQLRQTVELLVVKTREKENVLLFHLTTAPIMIMYSQQRESTAWAATINLDDVILFPTQPQNQ